ncbi:response regulator [Dyadobacter fermentans]|uniref:Two component transcriptional regulator, LuxR family n=1 Tax=Dyadobacter fermentans (strain ATCC 700827 / DSM 18053 / CIP 107007 / KCTC 52180 / NS114) TaxID=471854 RepID=C6VZS6_DYAFD|nr:response regulator transcription factor [Dyadobacter fermentans]ACT93554.1 two component transcriptional regulator, LuxR family [Dyadobacter fermentans DSM 18053]
MIYLVVDDHFLVRMSMRLVLEDLYPHSIVHEAEDFEDAMSYLLNHQYDLILLDIDIPGGVGTSMIARIREHQQLVPILVCSAADEQFNALEYVSAGANGYLSKSAEKSETVRAIQTVMRKNRYVSEAVQERLLNAIVFQKQARKRPTGIKSLSVREREIAELLITGKWVKEIASLLDIQSNTVSTYKARIFEKLGVDNIIELAEKIRAR